jgi:hypothetical protein
VKSKFSSPVPYSEQPANRYYMTHYENFLYLNFISTKSDDVSERAQARKEIEIANRKMKYWMHHPNYDQTVINELCIAAKKKWQ